MRRERLWTSTIEVEPSNIIHDSLRCLHCEFRVRRANLVDEVWFFDRVSLKNGFRFAIVRNGPGDGYTPIREGESRMSFTQYAAGGLFRWVDYGFKTWNQLWESDRAHANWELENRPKKWAEFLNLFSKVHELESDHFLVHNRSLPAV